MVGNDKVWIVTENIAEPIAFGTGPEWMVKGKKDRTNRLEGSSALLATKRCAIGSGTSVNYFYQAQAFTLAERSFNRFNETGSIVFPDYQPIQDYVEVIRPGSRESMGLMEVEDFRATSDPAEAAEQE